MSAQAYQKLSPAGRKAVHRTLSAEAELEEFYKFARTTFRKRYKKHPRKTPAEHKALVRLLGEHGMAELKSAWTEIMGDLHPDLTMRPFSELIGKLAEHKIHQACVDPKAHMPPEPYSIWNWAYYALSKEGKSSFWLSARVTSRWTCQPKSTVNRSIRWLEKNGWLEKIKNAVPGPQGKGATYRIVGHNEWVSERGSGYSPEPGEGCVKEDEG